MVRASFWSLNESRTGARGRMLKEINKPTWQRKARLPGFRCVPLHQMPSRIHNQTAKESVAQRSKLSKDAR
jgi:hypothetical protein